MPWVTKWEVLKVLNKSEILMLPIYNVALVS